MLPVTGIILAGGRSTRMGRDKALLPLPSNTQVTFVEHIYKMLKALCDEVVLVARNATQAANYTYLDVRIILDETPDMGPLMGQYSGLKAIRSSHALVTAVDMPFMQAEIVAFLLAQPLDDALLIPLVNNIPQVLLAIYPRAILPVIEQRLREGRRDPRSLLEVTPVRYIEEAQLRLVDPQLRSFVNINTPAELAADRRKTST